VNGRVAQEVGFDGFRASYVRVPGYTNELMSDFHSHDTYELFYLCSGERIYNINGRLHYIKRGEVVLINTHVVHKTIPTNAPDYERITLQIPPGFLDSMDLSDLKLSDCFAYNSPALLLPKKEQTILESILHTILEEAANQLIGYKAAVQLDLAKALVYIHRHAMATNHQLVQKSQIQKRITEVVRYIGENYMQDLSIPELAKRFFISRSHLSRTFRKITGLTIIEYLNSVRINHAKKLLRSTGLSVLQISAETGFNSVTHFERTFKKTTGCSPSQYRLLHLR